MTTRARADEVRATRAGQPKDRHGQWCVGIRWYASSAVAGREGWFLFDPAGIRRLNPALLHQMHHSTGGVRLCRAGHDAGGSAQPT